MELPINIKSPPAHGPLSPVRNQLDISDTEVLSIRTNSESSSKSYSSWDNWDNYHEKSSYELGDQSFWDNKRDSRKIQIVSTDISDLSSFSGSEFSFPNSLLDIQNMAPSEACNTAAKELSRANSILQARVFMLDVGDIDSSYLHRVPEELNAIRDLLTDFIVKVNEFLLEFQSELDPSVIATWKEEISKAKDLVVNHKKSIWKKCDELKPPQPLTYFEQQTLDNQSKQLNLQETRNEGTVGLEEKRILGIAEVKYDSLKNLSTKILKIFEDRSEETLTESSDDEIKKYMRELADLKASVQKFFDAVHEFNEHTVLYKLAEEKHFNVANLKTKIEQQQDVYVACLEQEDQERALYTLDKSVGENVKWPSFSGALNEDFSKFKDKFENAAKLNKTSKTVQLTKLRECLSGYPLSLVPETTSDVITAFNVLSQLYGNVSRVLAFQKKKLAELGTFPDDSSKDAPRLKMQWLMNMKQIMEEYLRIGDSGDSKMYCEAFSVSSIGQFINAFPASMAEKLTSIECDGDGHDQLEGLIEKVESMRLKAQRVDIHNSLNPRTQPQNTGKKSNLTRNQKELEESHSKQPGRAYVDISKTSLQVHKNCKICVNAKNSDPTVNFAGHLGIWTTGCPLFNRMDKQQRADVYKALEICLRCLNPTKKNIDKKKIICGGCKPHKFTCTHLGRNANSRCLLHVWTCNAHKQEGGNKEVIKDFNSVWHRKTGEQVVMISSLPDNPAEISDLTVMNNEKPTANSEQPRVISSLTGQATPASIAQAARRLRRNEKRRNPDAEFLPVPDGQGLFLFCPVEGRTRDLNFFFDSGCTNALFEEGIPGNELRGQVVEKGPFIIHGVNNVKIVAGDEWLVQLYRADGRIQLVKGLSLKVVTSNFPRVSTAAAVEEVKANKPDCEELQSCRVPDLAGGSVDGLIGILYNSIFPVPVHTLPSGLTIYKSMLRSRNNRYTATIGGPHSTFEFLAGEVGGVAALLTMFRQGLEKYHKIGPPKVKSLPLTDQELSFNLAYYSQEGDQELQMLQDQKFIEEEIIHRYEEDDPTVLKHIPPNPSKTLLVCSCGKLCPQLFESSQTAVVNVSEEQRIRDLNSLKLKIMEGGLEISYRCVRCRDCLDCKNSDKTEHLTLREEAEMDLIKKSVSLDFENKRIICSLPLRGKELDFLTTNRDRALKVLEQQCKKYHKDIETRDAILNAFRKIFENGYASPLHELSNEEREAFLNKPLAYYIPWRVVFSDSLSTPCRPVLDGSFRTKLRPDGGGGRCLNDLVAKGKIETINLLKMVIRFCVGKVAFSGELKQFYNSCKLKPEFWNLQRFLWKDGLDPNSEPIEYVMKTLIYGVKSVSAQSEEAKILLADAIKSKYPEVTDLILNSIYVDDIGDSKDTLLKCQSLISKADKSFEMVGLTVKGWSISGFKPADTVSKDGLTVGVGGFGWNSFLDCLEVKVPNLHFGKKIRGRLKKGTAIFTGTFEELENFVPQSLTRRQVSSKFASIFDLLGKFGPILISAKVDLRRTFKLTDGWDTPMPPDLRQSWIKHFWKWEQLRGLQFSRALMPENALNCKMRLIAAVDMAEESINVGLWAGFPLE